MCGRFAVTLPSDAMAQLFGASPANALPDVPNYNVCPTNDVHVVWSDGGHRRLGAMRWGFVPHWYKSVNDGPLLINARAETIAEKPAFKVACRARRCLIPANGYYEWTKGEDGHRLPWYIYPAQNGILAFAGVWQDWEQDSEAIRTCAIVTTGANRSMARLHNREPVIIAQDDWPMWLGEMGKGASVLMRSAPEELLAFHRVSTQVNSNRATGRDLTEALPAA